MTKYKDVPPRCRRPFLEKAGEWLRTARTTIDTGDCNSAVSSRMHCGINAVDAATVLRTGKRAAGSRADALRLLRSVFAGRDRAGLERGSTAP